LWDGQTQAVEVVVKGVADVVLNPSDTTEHFVRSHKTFLRDPSIKTGKYVSGMTSQKVNYSLNDKAFASICALVVSWCV
jgi:hypothetical protein